MNIARWLTEVGASENELELELVAVVVEELVVADELITTVDDAGADEDADEEEPKSIQSQLVV